MQVLVLTRPRSLPFVVAGLIAITIMSSAASAQPGRSPEAEQACTPDVMRLCSEYIPNVPPIVNCLKRKRLQLSAQCRRFMRPLKKVHRR